MLGWRLVVSAILIPSLVMVFWLDAQTGGFAPILLAFCLLLAVRSAWELVDLLRARSFHPNYLLTAGLSCGVVLAGWMPHAMFVKNISTVPWEPWEWIALAFIFSVLALFLAGAIRYREPGKSMETLGAELIVVSYVGLLLAATAQLRFLHLSTAGYVALGSLIIAAKCGDIGAYTLGRLFGKRKMVPLLSPSKTWMGALGAVLGAAFGSLAWFWLAAPMFGARMSAVRPVWSILFGAVIGVVGLIGDLCESLIKRDVGRKDSAALMPGFGGLLDLLDSVLYAGPVAYLLWRTLPLAG